MGENYGMFPKKHREGIFSAISAGFFFLLVGAIFVIRPALFQGVIDFFQGFDLVTVPHTTGFTVWAPVFPRAHLIVYRAFEEFAFVFGVFQLVILALRFIAGSPWAKKAETASNFVFWVGAGYLALTILIQTTRFPAALTAWFVFWAALVMLLGLSLIIRAVILAAAYTRRTM